MSETLISQLDRRTWLKGATSLLGGAAIRAEGKSNHAVKSTVGDTLLAKGDLNVVDTTAGKVRGLFS